MPDTTVNIGVLPKCPKCENGSLLPISGYQEFTQGLLSNGCVSIPFSKWVCSSCKYTISRLELE